MLTRLWVPLLTTLLFVVALLAIAEMGLRLFMPTHRLLFGSPCLINDPRELVKFRPNCDEIHETPFHVRIQTNEDGFRDRPRAFFQERGAVLLLGGSDLDVVRFEIEDGLAAALERRIGPALGAPLLNLGLRGTGPEIHWLRARRAMQSVPVRGAIWIFNRGDVIDDAFFRRSLEERGQPRREFSLTPYIAYLSKKFSGWYIAHYLQTFYVMAPELQRLTANRPTEASAYCGPFLAMSEEMRRRGAPLVFVSLDVNASRKNPNYITVPTEPRDLNLLIDCARRTGFPLIEAHREFREDSRYFYPDDDHITKEGNQVFADWLAEPLTKAFASARSHH